MKTETVLLTVAVVWLLLSGGCSVLGWIMLLGAHSHFNRQDSAHVLLINLLWLAPSLIIFAGLGWARLRKARRL